MSVIFSCVFIPARNSRRSRPEMYLWKGVLEICSKFMGNTHSEVRLHTSAWVFSCKSTNLLHIFRTPFLKNTSRWLLLKLEHFRFRASLRKNYHCMSVFQVILVRIFPHSDRMRENADQINFAYGLFTECINQKPKTIHESFAA